LKGAKRQNSERGVKIGTLQKRKKYLFGREQRYGFLINIFDGTLTDRHGR
jgi:hypothetical protein